MTSSFVGLIMDDHRGTAEMPQAPESSESGAADAARLAFAEAQQLAIKYWVAVGTDALRCAALLTESQKSGRTPSTSDLPDLPANALGCPVPHPIAADRIDQPTLLREAVWAAELAQRKLAVARWRGARDERSSHAPACAGGRIRSGPEPSVLRTAA